MRGHFAAYRPPPMPELPSSVALVTSIVLLAGGAELLVRGAVALAQRCGLSSFFIGLAIVGFGTSTPELTASVRAALDGRDDIALGNVVGSNVMNVAFILGLTSLIRPIPLPGRVVRGEIWIALAASFVPFLALTAEGRLTRAHGIAMLVGLVLFLIRGYVNGRRNGHQPTGQELLESEPVVAPHARIGVPVALLLIAIGLAALVFGGGMLVDAAVEVARGFGVSELVIGLTVVAAGTSAPELVTSIVAAARGHSDIAVGNVLGSNVFNILCILGITCVVTPQAVSSQLLRSDVPAMIVSTVLMLPMVRFGRVPRIGGAVLLVGYVGYVTWRVLGGSAT